MAGGRVNGVQIWNGWIEENKLIDLVVVRERKRQIPAQPPVQGKARSDFYIVLKIGSNIEIAQLGHRCIRTLCAACVAEQETGEPIASEVPFCVVHRVGGGRGFEVDVAGTRLALLVILESTPHLHPKVDSVTAPRV